MSELLTQVLGGGLVITAALAGAWLVTRVKLYRATQRPVAPIEDLTDGETAHVSGTVTDRSQNLQTYIDGVDVVAAIGYGVVPDSGTERCRGTEWHVTNFVLEDSTGTIAIEPPATDNYQFTQRRGDKYLLQHRDKCQRHNLQAAILPDGGIESTSSSLQEWFPQRALHSPYVEDLHEDYIPTDSKIHVVGTVTKHDGTATVRAEDVQALYSGNSAEFFDEGFWTRIALVVASVITLLLAGALTLGLVAPA